MNERIKIFRTSLKLSQPEFGKALNVSVSAVKKWESGENTPSDAVVSLMEIRFNLNKQWLLTGEGDMTIKISREDELAAFFGDVLRGNPDFRRRLLIVLARMSIDEWALIERKARELFDEQ